MNAIDYSIRVVELGDLEVLVELEKICFESDRLSRRSFQRWLKGEHCIFRVLICEGNLCGYALTLLHSGTRLARMYSIAVHPSMRNRGFGRALLEDSEALAVESGRFFMRLEVSKTNEYAIRLYRSVGYEAFQELHAYYEDHSDALRMQKRIRRLDIEHLPNLVPWYQQTTDFTCGPAALMMAMASRREDCTMSQGLELDLWREATSIYMTSGHGGSHPLGLALAAQRRGFRASVHLSHHRPLFLEGVRSEHKKQIMTTVHQQFLARSIEQNIPIHYKRVSIQALQRWLDQGSAVCILISSYRLNGDKAPHWVVVTAHDSLCFYLHDPDVEKLTRNPIDCQYIPVAKDEFAKMITYGSQRFSAVILID